MIGESWKNILLAVWGMYQWGCNMEVYIHATIFRILKSMYIALTLDIIQYRNKVYEKWDNLPKFILLNKRSFCCRRWRWNNSSPNNLEKPKCLSILLQDQPGWSENQKVVLSPYCSADGHRKGKNKGHINSNHIPWCLSRSGERCELSWGEA